MTHEEINIEIAESLGWTNILEQDYCEPYVNPYEGPVLQFWQGTNPDGDTEPLPDYCNDLNLMHEAERTMGDPQLWVEYQSYLSDVMGYVGWIYHATAAQRAEAFLKTLNLWTP